MSNWTESPDRPGYRRKVIQHGPATIIIERPILDEAQAAKAQAKAKAALEAALGEYYRRTAPAVAG